MQSAATPAPAVTDVSAAAPADRVAATAIEALADRLIAAYCDEGIASGAAYRYRWDEALVPGPAAEAIAGSSVEVRLVVACRAAAQAAVCAQQGDRMGRGSIAESLATVLWRSPALVTSALAAEVTAACARRDVGAAGVEGLGQSAPVIVEPDSADTLPCRLAGALAAAFAWHGGYLSKVGAMLAEAIGAAPSLPVAVQALIATLDEPERGHWHALLAHAAEAKQARPGVKWLKQARTLLDAVGVEAFTPRTLAWFALLDAPPTRIFSDVHAQTVRGFAWFCSLIEDAELARALARLAEALLRRLPDHSPRSQLGANACILALGLMPGAEPAAQLGRLRRRLKDGNARNAIERALELAMQRTGLGREDLEELTVPTLGLDAAGGLRRELDGYIATLTIAGARPGEWQWRDPAGKPLKALPAKLKAEHAAALRALRRERDDLGAALLAQRDRIEGFMQRERVWPLGVWRERYLDQPLLRALVGGLIWRVEADGRAASVLWRDGHATDEHGGPVAWLTDETCVSLWHPLDAELETLQRWRDRLDALAIVQPFKQAYREVYLLTDAERTTGTYSNRFAAHIIRQHQFKRLCADRGWHYTLQVASDRYTAPRALRALPDTNLRAEFWVEEQRGGEDTWAQTSSVLLYCATDQVRFVGPNGAPRPLTDVPPRLFSEVMREVDLFVGVASIGNDPAWQDRGAGALYQAYWQRFAFGELSGSAITRREALARLLPRLSIRARCTLEERFLVVRGERRTYRIHLGSGNIQMEPGNQYLCIVPARAGASANPADAVPLPFEGDGTLSVILSKAFMLADDTHITDPTILSQLARGSL